MGMYSYSCKKCGPKDQFDWMPRCAVKIAGLKQLVQGRYDGYGRVEVQVQGMKDNNKPAIVIPAQFDYQFESGTHLIAYWVYCNGEDPNATEEQKLMSTMLKGQSKMMAKMMKGGMFEEDDYDYEEEDEPPRFCVPKDATVLTELTMEQYTKALMDSAKKVADVAEKKRKAAQSLEKKDEKAKKASKTMEGGDGVEEEDDQKPKAATTAVSSSKEGGD